MDPRRRHCVCGGDGAAARARTEMRGFLDEVLRAGHPVPVAAQDAALLVASELVANAVRHTPGPCTLDVSWGRGGIDIDVTDPSPEAPRLRRADRAGAGGGYGWPLVRRLATEVAVRPTGSGGKTVHAHLPALG
ncbi:ATP-binding protein [Streptomyces sp. NPDC089919]|uniref:ATP-binding protein n=1 Tax=Streptomyces sp. NPDC089919 TaxID=3155188 RepID=UPI00343940CA